MFKFKGISSNEMQVVIQEEEAFKAKASQRYEITEIDGYDGAYFDELGYSCVERPIYVQCLNTEKLDDILSWLNGEGELEYQGRKTKARFYNEYDPQRKACIKIIDTSFIRDPFWIKAEDEYSNFTEEVINEGNIKSRPKIKLIKTSSSEVDITINGTRFVYNFGTDMYVEIDCKEKTVKYEGLNRNRQMDIGYDFPFLSVGQNSIIINSGACDIQIKAKDRWL